MKDKKGGMKERREEGPEGEMEEGKREKDPEKKGHSQGPSHPPWTSKSWHPASQTLGRDLWESATGEGTREIKLPPGLPVALAHRWPRTWQEA